MQRSKQFWAEARQGAGRDCCRGLSCARGSGGKNAIAPAGPAGLRWPPLEHSAPQATLPGNASCFWFQRSRHSLQGFRELAITLSRVCPHVLARLHASSAPVPPSVPPHLPTELPGLT